MVAEIKPRASMLILQYFPAENEIVFTVLKFFFQVGFIPLISKHFSFLTETDGHVVQRRNHSGEGDGVGRTVSGHICGESGTCWLRRGNELHEQSNLNKYSVSYCFSVCVFRVKNKMLKYFTYTYHHQFFSLPRSSLSYMFSSTLPIFQSVHLCLTGYHL